MMGTVAGVRDTPGLTFQDKASVLQYPDQALNLSSPFKARASVSPLAKASGSRK